jgi:capsule polysaccharide export protein KpsC/LpsZ
MRACQAEGVNFVIHERGANKDKYALFPDNSPHDLKYIQSEVLRLWNESDPEQREKEGRSFYELTASGQEIGWFSFTSNQKNVLPENWQTDQYNVVIFSSSEDEFASLSEEWHNHIYPSQINGIKRIAADLLSEKQVHFFLRVHPNLKKVDNEEKRALYALEAENLTIVKAESEVSSYKLLKEANLILTFGSTMGIEAVYQGKPSILAGRSLYSELGATYNPTNHQEVVELIKNPPPALDKTGAIIYGHYCKTFGTNFRFYKPESLDKGSFHGVYLNRDKRVSEKWIDRFFEIPFLKSFTTRVYARLKKNRLARFRKLK